MRRLIPRQHDDQGVATLFLVLAMFAILVGAAFAIDVTRYALEARYARNSADATALAIAADCALTNSATADYSVHRKPGQTPTVTPEPPSCGNGEVKVKITKPITDGILLQQSVGDVDRSATARWGGVGAADTIPLTLSECDFQRITKDGMPTGTQTVYFHQEDVNETGPFPCNASSSGQNIPGGFGWISGEATDNPCIVHVNLSTPSDQGNSPPATCDKDADWEPLLDRDWLIPIYGATDGHSYTITGFAQFTFEGYKWNGGLNGGTLDGKNVTCPHPDTGAPMAKSVTCLQGRFKEILTQGPGGGFDFDATVVWLDS
jgi:hypothetical protein